MRRQASTMLAVVSVVLLAACGGGSSGASSPSTSTSGTSNPAASTTTTAPGSTTTTAGSGSGSSPTLSVTPSQGLHDGQQVQAHGSGFSAHLALVAVECAALGSSTSAADCDISHPESVQSDAQGAVSFSFSVTAGPFGADHRTCDPSHACQIAVSQPTTGAHAQRATATIHFG